jgi:hypothetical protein
MFGCSDLIYFLHLRFCECVELKFQVAQHELDFIQ